MESSRSDSCGSGRFEIPFLRNSNRYQEFPDGAANQICRYYVCAEGRPTPAHGCPGVYSWTPVLFWQTGMGDEWTAEPPTSTV